MGGLGGLAGFADRTRAVLDYVLPDCERAMNPYEYIQGDALTVLRGMPDESVNCIVTSPPYWGLREYGSGDHELGKEPDFRDYVDRLVEIGRELRRVLRSDGTFWLNIGDTRASAWPCPRRNQVGSGSLENGKRENRPPRLSGLKEKDLAMIPARVAIALQDDGWYLRSKITWEKTNGMPEPVRDRPTDATEEIFLFSKSERYWYDPEAIREDSGANLRNVWRMPTSQYDGDHYATFPEELPRRCIRLGCPEGGVVLDPFAGTGTTMAVAVVNSRRAIGIELNPKYVELIRERMRETTPSLFIAA